MTKEFDDLISSFSSPGALEQRKKELEDNDLHIDFDEEQDEVYVFLWKNQYTFDQKGYKIFEKLCSKGVLTPNKEGYLCVKDDWGDLVPIHNSLKRAEVEALADKMKCPTKDIHVHHKTIENGELNHFDNRLVNLEVVHKDVHAQRHGYPDWETMQKCINERQI